MFQRIPIYASAINCTWVEQQRHIGEIISRNGPHKETELPCGNRLGDEFVSNLSLLCSLRSSLLFVLLGPSSATGRNQYGLGVPPRTMSIHSVKRENWRVVLSGALIKFLYYVFVSERRQKERKREREISFVRIWISPLIVYSRKCSLYSVREFLLIPIPSSLFGKVHLFCWSRYRDLMQPSSHR